MAIRFQPLVTEQAASSQMFRIMLLVLILAVAAMPVQATKYAGEFLRIGAGARSLGMGGAVTASTNNADAVYWNPAGITQVEAAEISLMHAEQFSDLADYDYGAYVLNLDDTGTPGALGISVIRFAVSDILITKDAYEDVNGNHQYDHGIDIVKPEEFYTDSDTETALFISYGRDVKENLSLGGSLKLIRQDLAGNGSFGIGADLGMLYRMSKAFTLGARFADVTTTQLFWDGGTRETIKPSLYVGGAYRFDLEGLHLDLVTTADLALTFEGRDKTSSFATGSMGGDPAFGCEAWFHTMFAARVGWQESGVTGGAGFRLGGLGVDYAFVPHDDLGSSHRVSASYLF
jgi:hypothetical protein